MVELDKAIELDPNLFEAFYLYAYACRDSGDTGRRGADVQAGGRACARTISARYSCWSQMLRDLGRDEEFREAARVGLERAERALGRTSRHPASGCVGAATLAATGRADRALEWAERALTDRARRSADAIQHRLRPSLAGRAERAIDLLERMDGARANKSDPQMAGERHRFRFSLRRTSRGSCGC